MWGPKLITDVIEVKFKCDSQNFRVFVNEPGLVCPRVRIDAVGHPRVESTPERLDKDAQDRLNFDDRKIVDRFVGDNFPYTVSNDVEHGLVIGGRQEFVGATVVVKAPKKKKKQQ